MRFSANIGILSNNLVMFFSKICSLHLAMAKGKKTDFELAVINRVKEIRTEKGLSQYDVSVILGTSSSFIGQVETSSNPSKYNLNHLNRLAYEWGCSPQSFIPAKPISEKNWDEN